MQRLKGSILRLLGGIAVLLLPRRDLHGVELRAGPTRNEKALPNLYDAVDLLRRFDPGAWGRVQRDLRRIIVTDSQGPCYLQHLEATLLPEPFLSSVLPQRIAMTLVHEAAHGRITRAGIGYELACRDRIERRCTLAAIATGRRMPGTDMLIRIHQEALENKVWRKRWE